ncbi:MAG: histidine kinase dimerization/phospho-acceptor domain-containing protein [Anaerolineales bacterium]|nr:histidine kinase dimerization/phospho-acceptor domain-containing protein [Anaerolineales bacterium]
MQEALRKLSELDRLKANFIANLSHELRTPLLHIQGYIEMLATESLGLLNEEQKSALQASQPAIGQLAGLIDDLIQFSVAQRDKVSLPTAP